MTDMAKVREAIAECFKIAREEGALRKYANGLSDAEDVLNTPIKIERECTFCNRTGVDPRIKNVDHPCPYCNGTGIQPIEFTLMGLVEKELK